MELGADGVLMNTAIAGADDPVVMAEAMKLGVEAGRLAYLAGRIPKRMYASASSPIDRYDRRRRGARSLALIVLRPLMQPSRSALD